MPPIFHSSFPNDTIHPIYDLTKISIQPAFPGGYSELSNFLKQNTSYPTLAKKNNVQGKAYITFIIDEDGAVINVELYKGINRTPNQQETTNTSGILSEKQLAIYAESARQLEEEALRVIRIIPKWSPAILKNKPVRIRYILPFNFRLK